MPSGTRNARGRPLEQRDLDDLARAAGLELPLLAPLDALASVRAKRTAGSTAPGAVAAAISELEAVLAARERKVGA